MSSTAPPPIQTDARRLRVVFAGLLLVMLLAALDSTIVATALPTIVGDLGGLNHLSWVVTAYLLAQTVVTPLYGKLGDQYGRKIVLQIGLVVFLVGSAACGAAQNLTELIAFRALQGLGGGGLLVSAQAVIGDVVSPRERGRYQGIFGAVFGLASVAGPLLGGFFTTSLSWRWIFYVNIPLGLLAMFVLAATLPAVKERVHHRVDYLGTGLLAAGLSAVILLTTLGGTTYAWGSAVVVGLGVAGALLLLAFLAAERRAAEPVLPLSLFRNPVFAVTSGVGLIVGFALFGSVTYLPLFLQVVNGASPTSSGIQILPVMGGLLITSILSGQLISRTGRYKPFPILGTGIMVIGLYLLSGMDVHTSTFRASLDMLVLGLGLGMVMQVLVLAVQNAVDYKDLGVATSGATLFRSIGGSLGTAVLGSIFANRLAANLARDVPSAALHGSSGGSVGAGTINAAAIRKLPAPLHDAYLRAFTQSLSTVFLVASAIVVAGFALSWLIRQLPLRETVATAGVGETFAVPKPTDSFREIARALSSLVGRETVRREIERIAARAAVDLGPAECWLLGRIGDEPGGDLAAIGGADQIALPRLERAFAILRERDLVTSAGGAGRLTPAGESVREQLRVARCARMNELLRGWQPEDHDDIGELVERLARDLATRAPATA